MVQSYQSPVRVYKHPFELIMAAYVKRFPTCEMIPIMADSEILTQSASEGGSIEEVSRRCKLHIDAPYLLKKLMGVDLIVFIQTNTLDRRKRTLAINAHNESFSSRVIINENCKYFVHPENPNWTCFEQAASLDVKSFFGFENTVEKIAMKQYSLNISKGTQIIEHFIEELRREGITSVNAWDFPLAGRTRSNTKVADGNGNSSEEDYLLSSGESTDHLRIGASAFSLPKKLDQLGINEDTMSKLDSDYIRRCLGNLTPLQESRLVQLKKCIMELQKGKVPSDTTLLRFLKARDFNLEKSREMLSQSLIWRKKNQVNKMLANYQSAQVLKDYFCGGWHHTDKDGRPLYLLRLGQMDVKGLIKSVGEEGILKHVLHICEEGLRLTADATDTLGTPVTTWTMLVDLEGLNMRHLWRPGIRALLKIIELVENNYPETMEHVLIIRAPRVFPILWTLVSTFIDENSRSKFLFYGGNDYQEAGGLVDFMSKEVIPDFLGGECKTSVLEGGLVPKDLYLPGEETDAGRQSISSDHSIYESVSLAKGQVHEMVILVEEAGSVVCWDFDVMKSDVNFSVLRTKVPIVNRQEPPHSPTGTLGVIDAVISGEDGHRSVIEKTWHEGKEYFRVEPTLVFHDGESVQGSHVTSHMGTYILQWRYHEASSYTSPLDIIDSITAPKAKLMYYYETLKSAEYKGSMTSLQSGQSGFSCLSSNTGKSLNSSCISR